MKKSHAISCVFVGDIRKRFTRDRIEHVWVLLVFCIVFCVVFDSFFCIVFCVLSDFERHLGWYLCVKCAVIDRFAV